MSSDFKTIAAFGDNNFSFLWPADIDDPGVLARLQERWFDMDEGKARCDENIAGIREKSAI